MIENSTVMRAHKQNASIYKMRLIFILEHTSSRSINYTLSTLVIKAITLLFHL